MKGIVLAGGKGSRLYPITHSVSKQLMPIYDKPMIFYPISILMLSGIKDILLISSPDDIDNYKKLLGNGSKYGINLSYLIQENPNGIAEAFIIGKKFIGKDSVCLILGDNIFYGHGFTKILNMAKLNTKENLASIFGYYVSDPERYGVVEFNDNNDVISIEEKPQNPKSNYAVVGLYFYPNSVVDFVKDVIPSNRGELEITSVNDIYRKNKNLKVEILGRGFTWLDTGTHETLLDASNFVKDVEKQRGFKIACLEEIAYRYKYLSKEDLNSISKKYNNSYGKYLKNIK